jgi:hypothetical protein
MDSSDKKKVLSNEQPLMIPPKLASIIGLNEAIILQQIHYWNLLNEESGRNYKDGYYWTFNSYELWKEQFPFWSPKTIQRTINKLEKIGLIVAGCYNKMPIDRTKWYRIDYKMLESIEKCPFGQIDLTMRSKCPNQQDKMTNTIPETTPEISPETTERYQGSNSASELTPCVFLYFSLYEEVFREKHPYIKIEKLKDISLEIESFIDENGLDLEGMSIIIGKYFNTKFDNCDYNICHFASQDIMLHRFYEELF